MEEPSAQSSPFYLIAGLGNPGRRYQANRHNIGFLALDRLAVSAGLSFTQRKQDALVCQGTLDGNRVFLAKPQTYMNLAGRSVGGLARYFHVQPSDLLVVLDDIDLPMGKLRLRPAGGSGGHRGLQSVIERMGTQEVPRLRIGVGRPPGRRTAADYVLEDFDPRDHDLLSTTLDQAEACIRRMLSDGIQAAMTAFNRDSGGE